MKRLRVLAALVAALCVSSVAVAKPVQYGPGKGGGTSTPATPSAPGSMSAADKTKLDGFTSGSWFDLQAQFCASKVPALTEFAGWKAGVSQLGGPTTLVTGQGIDGTTEGAGLTATSGQTIRLSSVSVFQHPKTGSYCSVWYVKFSAVAAAFQTISLLNAGGTNLIGVVLATGDNASRWVLAIGAAPLVPLAVGDTSFHAQAITADGTTIKEWQDGVLEGSGAESGVVSDEPYYPTFFNQGSPVVVTKALWGYVAP